jgi:hypothetical protein
MPWWSELWKTRAHDWVFGWLEPSQAPAAPSGELEPDTAYLSVFLKSARIVDVRRGLTSFYGAVHSHIRLAHKSGGQAEFNVVTTPSELRDVDARSIDRVIQVNQRLLGPVPYVGGDLEIELGLFSIASGNLVAPYLDLVQTLSEAAGVAYVSSALPFAGPILKAMRLLTSAGPDVTLEIGLATTVPTPRLGYCVAIRAPKSTVNLRKLRLDPDDFRLLTSEGPLAEYPYVVLQVTAEPRRSDWFTIPELASAYRALQAQFREGRASGVQEALAVFHRAARTCNDLLDHQARQLIQKVDQIYAAEPEQVRGSGGRQRQLPDLHELEL